MNPTNEKLPKGIQYFTYKPSRGNQPGLHPWVLDIETKIIRAEACANAAAQLKSEGFTPDLICGHPGWGEMLFLKDIWPSTPSLTYQEFFYNPLGFDYDFDKELQGTPNWQARANIRTKTANQLLNLESSTWSVTPTKFQQQSYPEAWRNRISVIHDGINTQKARPSNNQKSIKVSETVSLNPDENIITFVNRNLEPYRGCHTFIRSIPIIQRLIPDAKILIVGETSGVSYGAKCPSGEWKDYFLTEIHGQYDPRNVYFVGTVPYEQFIPILQISKVHVYLTYPFVLSWSLLEAMSCGCAVVGSDTAPVKEVITDQKNGLLVDFFNPNQLAEAIAELLKNRKLANEIGKAARNHIVNNFELKSCVQRQLALMELVANRALE